MIDIRAAIKERLLSDSAISTIVGGPNGGIYPGIVPQGRTDPTIVQNLITETTGYHMQGQVDLAVMRIQIGAWAQTPDQAVDLANRVKDRLSGFAGTVAWGDATPQLSAVIQAIFVENAADEYDDVRKMHGRRRDYVVNYVE